MARWPRGPLGVPLLPSSRAFCLSAHYALTYPSGVKHYGNDTARLGGRSGSAATTRTLLRGGGRRVRQTFPVAGSDHRTGLFVRRLRRALWRVATSPSRARCRTATFLLHRRFGGPGRLFAHCRCARRRGSCCGSSTLRPSTSRLRAVVGARVPASGTRSRFAWALGLPPLRRDHARRANRRCVGLGGPPTG